MLQLILGSSGSGKTFTVIQRIGALLQQNREISPVLLVPEQFSFETEKRLLSVFGPQEASRVKVYSFTRLSEMILQKSGVKRKKSLDEGTRLLLLNQALKETTDKRELPFREGSVGQLSLLLDILKEWKQNAVTDETASEVTAQLPPDSLLKKKLSDLSLVKEAFETLALQGFDDPQELLSQAYDCLRENGDGAGTYLFLDGFMGFTVQEERLLSCLISRAAEVTVAIGTDTLSALDEGLGLFMLPTETANRLIHLAKDSGTPVASPLYLTEDKRHSDEALCALCDGVFRSDGEAYEEETAAVTVLSCADKSEECKAAAREIRRFLRHGGRARDVAVVARSMEEYRGSLEMALQTEGVPYYLDNRESIRGDALVETVCAALRAVTGRFQTEDVLRLLKTGLSGFSPRSVAKLENYVYQWSLSGARWKEPFTENPGGLSASVTEKTKEQLFYLNILRHRVMRPLLRLQTALSGAVNGKTFAEAVFAYLADIRASQMTRYAIRRLDANGQIAVADRTERVWDATMELLDVFAKGTSQLQTAKEWAELFSMTASAADLGALPQSMDAVQVGTADRIRLSEPRVVFLLGANEGEFPAVPASGGYLSDRERKTLKEKCGLRLSKDPERELTEERLYAYNALSAASEAVVVTYARSNLAGESLAKSVLVTEIERLLPHCRKTRFCTDENWMPETPEEALSYYTATYRCPTNLTAAVRKTLCEIPAQKARLDALERAAENRPWAFEKSENAVRLFGKNMTLSASKIDTYYLCPFSYFCKYGLRVSSRQKAELNALETGSLIHSLLEKMVPHYRDIGFDAVTYEQVEEDVDRAVDAYAEEMLGGLAEKTPRFLYLLSRLKRISLAVMWHLVEELAQSEFTPVKFEWNIGDGEGTLQPLSLTAEEGGTVTVIGKIDRVDLFENGGVSYIRIVDYKTGEKSFRLADVVNGLNLQMLLYLFAVWENGGEYYENVAPAGILYMPATLPVVDGDGDEAKRKEKQNKRLKMDGLLLADETVLQAMDRDLVGTYIPAVKGKSGFNGNSSKVATAEQLELLKRRSEKLLLQMARELWAGHVEARPTDEKTACVFCDFRDVCGFETGAETRPMDYFPEDAAKNKKTMGLLALAEEIESGEYFERSEEQDV